MDASDDCSKSKYAKGRITAETVLFEMGIKGSEGMVESEGLVVMDEKELFEVSWLADSREDD